MMYKKKRHLGGLQDFWPVIWRMELNFIDEYVMGE